MTELAAYEIVAMEEMVDNLNIKMKEIESNIYSAENDDLSGTVLQLYEMKKTLKQIAFNIEYLQEEYRGRSKKDKSR